MSVAVVVTVARRMIRGFAVLTFTTYATLLNDFVVGNSYPIGYI